MQVEVVKWGNSSAVRLPSAVLKELQVVLGDRLELKTEDGKIVLELARSKYRLEDMLAAITKENRHLPADFGAPVGREAW
ncbi:PemI family protein [Burkholderiales bacterium]|nr:PemI family protein [Burkholderiales bacterium]